MESDRGAVHSFVKGLLDFVRDAISKETRKRKTKTCTVKHYIGVDLLQLLHIFQSDTITTELKTITVIAVYFTIIGLVYKFKANILMHLLFFRNHTYKDYIKSVPKLLRNIQ